MIFFEYLSAFFLGGLLYGGLETLWRGHTHWTMLITGGICAVFIYIISNFSREPLWKKWIMSTCTITTVEFLTGSYVNLRLGWNVWHYNDMPLNLMGQICLPYTLLWFLLSVFAVWACGYLRRIWTKLRTLSRGGAFRYPES